MLQLYKRRGINARKNRPEESCEPFGSESFYKPLEFGAWERCLSGMRLQALPCRLLGFLPSSEGAFKQRQIVPDQRVDKDDRREDSHLDQNFDQTGEVRVSRHRLEREPRGIKTIQTDTDTPL